MMFLPVAFLAFVSLLAGAEGLVLPNASSRLTSLTPTALLASTIEQGVPAPVVEKRTIAVGTEVQAEEKNKDLSGCFPGRDENVKFECDPSVALWRDFQSSRFATAEENVREMANIASRFARLGAAGSSYFAGHAARSAYFVGTALLGGFAFDLHERLQQRENVNEDSQTTGFLSSLSAEGASRLILEALMCYEQDYEWIRRGTYREPWDMKLGHRQSNPVNIATQTSRLVRESIGTLVRKKRATDDGKKVAFFGETNRKGTANDFYPAYYQNAFHYQTDGWMSSESANVYETSTETLFLGRQDSMQRASLPPIMDVAKKFQSNKGSRPMKVLEVACGTGRFMTFVRDSLSLDAEYTAVDLSPFYLEKACDNDAYWRQRREVEEGQNPSSTNKRKIAPATLVQGQAEQLPFDDESFDAVVCVYLFHEIPRDVRSKVAAEMSRIVSPGGTVVFTDSIQLGDRPSSDPYLGNFEAFNEPYYEDYINDPISKHFESAGLEPRTKILRSSTKSLSFKKPGNLQFLDT